MISLPETSSLCYRDSRHVSPVCRLGFGGVELRSAQIQVSVPLIFTRGLEGENIIMVGEEGEFVLYSPLNFMSQLEYYINSIRKPGC